MQNNQEPQLGDIMYEDIDNNGNINDADRTITVSYTHLTLPTT